MLQSSSSETPSRFLYDVPLGSLGEIPLGGQARRPAQQQVATRAIRPRLVDAMICDPAADPVKRFCLLCTTVNFVTENRSRMQICRVPSLLDVDRAGSVVDTFNSTEVAGGGFHLVTRSNLRFLRRKLITVDRTGHSAADPLHELHTGETVSVPREVHRR